MSDGGDTGAGLRERIELLENRLAASEQRLQLFLDGIQDGVFAVNADGRFLFVNEFIAGSSGFPREAFVGRHFLEMVCPEHHEATRRNFERTLAGERVPPYELAYRTASGEQMWVELNTAQYVDDGEVVGVFAISRNIQRRKQMEGALRESEEKYRSLIETMPNVVGIVQDGKVVFANSAAERLFGYDPVSNTRSISSFAAPAEKDRIADLHRRRVAGESVPAHYRTVVERIDGQRIPIEVYAVPIEYGGRPAFQCVAFDLSEREQLERDLQQIQRMDALGTLAGGIAHDFNNLLTGMLAAAELLERRPEQPDKVRESADVIVRAARRAGVLTQQLLGFARRDATEMRAVDLGELIEEVVAILSRTVSSKIRIEQAIDFDEAIALGDDAQLQQVLLNLAINARDAMPDGGDLTIEAGCCELTDETLLDVFEITPGMYTRISVTDTGEGIAPDVLDRIFEPFYTTKQRGRGSGMGLAVVYGIVRAHRGAIEVCTNPGEGTTVAVFLPHDTRDHVERAAPAAEPSQGSGLVLLVNDESVVLESTAAVLESLGYEVIACADGHAAVDALRRSDTAVVAALVDVRMPGMDGWQCSAALKDIDPSLPVLMTSGNATNPPADWNAGNGLLPKPYSVERLASALAELISQA